MDEINFKGLVKAELKPCVYCGAPSDDICAYPSENKPGCPRTARLEAIKNNV